MERKLEITEVLDKAEESLRRGRECGIQIA